MARIRVLRLLEYTYPSVEDMELDMARWVAQGTTRFGSNPMVIKSVILPPEVLDEPAREPGENPMIPGYCDASCAVSIGSQDHWCTPETALTDLLQKQATERTSHG